MVNYLVAFFLTLSISICSVEFSASVNQNQIAIGNSFTLTLTLKDGSIKHPPSIDALKEAFYIKSQQQLKNTSIINGDVSSSISWIYILVPKDEGEAIIPPISVQTPEGVISTHAITLQIVERSPSESTDQPSQIIVSTSLNTLTPYKNEPIQFTVAIETQIDATNIQIEKLNVENSIVEVNGDPKIYKKTINGINQGIIEFNYFITPLIAGKIKIPSLSIQGVAQAERKRSTHSFFDDGFSLFSLMHPFDLEPFELHTEEKTLEVQPPISDIIPWLPAKSIEIEDSIDESQVFRVGEPFIWEIKLVAKGIKSSQLPSLINLQGSTKEYKIYADKPELNDEINNGILTSYRKERYTLIPLQQGSFELPKVSLTWWNIEKKEKMTSILQQKSLKILPKLDQNSNHANPINDTSANLLQNGEIDEMTAMQSMNNRGLEIVEKPKTRIVFYFVILSLSLLLLTAITWGIYLKKQLSHLKKPPIHLKSDESQKHIILSSKDMNSKASSRTLKRDKNDNFPDLNPT